MIQPISMYIEEGNPEEEMMGMCNHRRELG